MVPPNNDDQQMVPGPDRRIGDQVPQQSNTLRWSDHERNFPAGEGKSDDDLILITQAQKGSQAAFRQLYERYHNKIHRLIGSMVGSAEDTNDIVQQTFTQAFRSLEKFKGQSSFYTWLYRIAVNAATDFRRKVSRQKEVGTDQIPQGSVKRAVELVAPKEDSPEAELYRKELARLIRKALDSLSEEHRTVMVLREINGLSYTEIAEVTGANIGTVMSRLHYGRKKLAEILEHWQIVEGNN
jgi:RNA polymerase sigma-70 factor (ECF subfamily)